MKRVRPVMDIALSRTDKLVEALAIAGLLFLLGYTIYNYGRLPQIIPIHYNLNGQIDRYGSKTTIWLLPAIALIIYTALSILNRYPHIFNYPVAITEENAPLRYKAATRMMRWLKLVIVLVFTLIVIMTVAGAHKQSFSGGKWLVPLLVIICLLPVVVCLVVLGKKSKA